MKTNIPPPPPTKNLYTNTMAALFIIANWWMDGWMNKMWHSHTTEYYSDIKKNKYWYSYNMTTWINLENIMLSENNQSQTLCYMKASNHKNYRKDFIVSMYYIQSTNNPTTGHQFSFSNFLIINYTAMNLWTYIFTNYCDYFFKTY